MTADKMQLNENAHQNEDNKMQEWKQRPRSKWEWRKENRHNEQL